jgi:acetylornithine deacetylase/succinyl-diaminopimelate desuccinylase-like protein
MDANLCDSATVTAINGLTEVLKIAIPAAFTFWIGMRRPRPEEREALASVERLRAKVDGLEVRASQTPPAPVPEPAP